MSVIERLKRLTGEQPGATPDDKQAALNDLRRRIEGIMSRREQAPPRPVRPASFAVRDLGAALGGEEVTNAFGACHFTRSRHTAGSLHGQSLIRDCLRIDMPSAALMCSQPQIAQLAPKDALFLDTETTGLSGGTGTFPFLIGLGWFEEGDFITCQLLARDFSEERAMLALLDELAADKRFLVTFNGKAFDVNLLSTRYVLGRLPDPLAGMPHLDLLNPSRRLLSHRTSNCRLVTLEAEVLGFHRVGDIPGWEIPQRYFDWLRTRDPGLLVDIMEHNRYDIVSMAALASFLTGVLSGRETHARHPGDLLAAAKVLHERGRLPDSRLMLEALLERPDQSHTREAQRLLSLIHKRGGRWVEAVSIWENLLAGDPRDIFAAEELAKWCEHVSRDIGRAITLVEQALADPQRLDAAARAALDHRLQRLLTKQGKAY